VAQAEESLTLARTGRRRVDASAEEVRAAAAGAKQAAAAANYSRTSLGKHIVYAPISGQVALRSVEPGESAQPGLPLLRLVAMDTVRITCRASDLQVAAMRVGQLGKVTVGALPGVEMLGRITDIAPQAEMDRRVFHVRLQVRNEGMKLRAGMFAQVQVVTAQHSGVTWIPRDAMVERGEDRVVYLVVDGKTKVRHVKVGAIEGLRVEIRSGVRPGDALILGGQSQLADGQKVKPVKAGAETETGPGPAASS
jgi:RND family efflux transporter MFP subunit